MLEKLFLQILNMSFTASIIIVFVLLLRFLLKKMPKIFSYALWSVVLFRLVCPFSFESFFSLLPINPSPIPANIAYQAIPKIDTGISVVNNAVNSVLPPIVQSDSINPLQVFTFIGSILWVAGIVALLIYSVISLLNLRYKLRNSIHEKDNIYTSNSIISPFVIGFFAPKIYLPASLGEEEKRYVVLHEQIHIKRRDHIVKILCFLVLCVHWFNPLVWVAFFISGKDMEMSCDESVIRRLGSNIKKDYSTSLLSLATGQKVVGGSPLAFGEGDTKTRIKNVLNYKKPAFWVAVVVIIAIAVLGVGLVTNPRKSSQEMNTISVSKLTPEEIVELAPKYQSINNNYVFKTDFRVSDDIKSHAYYIEVYQRGVLIETYVNSVGNLSARDSTMFSEFSINKDSDGRWDSVRYDIDMAGSSSSHPAIPFPVGFDVKGYGVTLSTNNGDAKQAKKIVAEQPRIIASLMFHSAQTTVFETYSCDYLMEHPEKIADYECVFLVKNIFSQKDEVELSSQLPSPKTTIGIPTKALSSAIITEYVNGEANALGEITQPAKLNALYPMLMMGEPTDEKGENGAPAAASYIRVSLKSGADYEDYFIYAQENIGDDTSYFVKRANNEIWKIDVGALDPLMAFITQEKRVDLEKVPADVDGFLRKISQSFQIKEGVARFTIPLEMPQGYAPSQLSVHVSGSMPMGDDGSNMSLHAFEKEDADRTWQLGEEYIERILDAEVPDKTEVYASFYLMEKGDESKYNITVSRVFPLRESNYTPSVEITTNGKEQKVVFENEFDDKLTFSCVLPEKWSLKAPSQGDAILSGDAVEIFADNVRIGSLWYDNFALYRDEAGKIPYMSVYGQIMLGSMSSWDNEYNEIYKDTNMSIATCKPMRNISFPGVSNAGALTVYNKGVLAYSADASKYIALELNEDLATDAQWQALAKSVKLSA